MLLLLAILILSNVALWFGFIVLASQFTIICDAFENFFENTDD
jgi:hypothetical protein